MSSSERWFSDEKDLQAHFIYLATAVREVTLSFEGEVLQGRLSMPVEQHLLPFHPHAIYGGRVGVPDVGTRVRLDYEGHGTSYSFRTRVARAAPAGEWLLHTPRTVERSDRRLVHRYRVVGQPDFRLRVRGLQQMERARAYPMVDISIEGLGFLYHPKEAPLERGTLLAFELAVPALDPRAGLLRVTNSRPDPRHPPGRVAGARFLDCAPTEARSLALALSLWEQQR